MAKCKSGFKREKGKCVKVTLFKGFRERSFSHQIITVVVTIFFALAIGLIISGILQLGFMVGLRSLWRIIIGVVSLVILIIIFRGVLNIKRR